MHATLCHAKLPAPRAAMVAGRPPIARYRTTRNFGLIMAYLLVFFFAYIVIAYFVQWPKRKAACAGRPLFSEFWLWLDAFYVLRLPALWAFYLVELDLFTFLPAPETLLLACREVNKQLL